MKLPVQTVWVQTLRIIKKEGIGVPLREPIAFEDGTVLEDDGYFYPGDWFPIGINVAKLLARKGDIEIPTPSKTEHKARQALAKIRALGGVDENR